MTMVKVRRAAAALTGLLVLSGGTYAATATAAATDPGGSSVSARATTHDQVWEREDIPFRTITRETNRLDKGVRRISQPGRVGVRVRIVKTTFEDGVEVDSKVVRNFVARKPVPRIVLVGTRVKPAPSGSRCDPNYSGCVPIASDVDCGGGSGNGPAYQWSPVRVTGNDIYGLDADGDGWGCED